MKKEKTEKTKEYARLARQQRDDLPPKDSLSLKLKKNKKNSDMLRLEGRIIHLESLVKQHNGIIGHLNNDIGNLQQQNIKLRSDYARLVIITDKYATLFRKFDLDFRSYCGRLDSFIATFEREVEE